VRRRPWLLPLLLVAGLLPAAAQDPCALGVSPPRLDIEDAQPGQAYLRTLSVQNRCDQARAMTVDGEGALMPWTRTDPGPTFTLEADGQASVQVRIEVPAGAGPGRREAILRFTAEATEDPGGSGASVREAIAARLSVTVGGTPRVELAWTGAAANDTDTRTPPVGTATLRNDGNVRATGTVAATVVPLGGSGPVASARASAEVEAGATGTARLAFPDPLPEGQYTMRFESVEPAGFAAEAPFTVAPPGVVPPHADLRALRHEPYVGVGRPARIDGAFANTGSVAIQGAQMTLEVRRGGELLASLPSPALVAAVGVQVNLTVYWTPPEAGSYELRAQATFDGHLTPVRTSILNAQGFDQPERVGGLAWLWLLLLAALALLAVGLWAWARSRRNAKPPS
jgi:hypothetical protein